MSDLPGASDRNYRVDRYDTLPKAHAEIMRLVSVAEDWARKYEGWRDGCLAAEAEVERLRELLAKVEALHHPSQTECGPDFCETCSDAVNEWVKWPCPTGEALTALMPALPEWLTDVERLREALAKVVSALERTERNFRLAVENKPVRDMTENLAENAAALASVPAMDAGDREPGPSEWSDPPQKAAWRALIPEAAAAIDSYCTPGEQVGSLGRLLAVEVLNVAYRHRGELTDAGDREPARDPLTLTEQQMCPNCITPWKCNGPHIEPASDAVRAAEPRSGQPEATGTSGGFEAVTEAHSDASEGGTWAHRPRSVGVFTERKRRGGAFESEVQP